jgi:site-specific recombinase XerD
MTLAGKSPKTIQAYTQAMSGLCAFAGKPPRKIKRRDVRNYLFHQIEERGLKYASVAQKRMGIKYFFTRVLKRPYVVGQLPPLKKSFTLPEVLSVEEVARLIDSAANPRDRVILVLAYGCGLRLSEIIRLRIADIQRDRKMVFVRGAKGRRDRYVPLSDGVLEELCVYYRICLSWNRNGEQTPWLFPTRGRSGGHIDKSVPARAFGRAKARAGLLRGKGIHTLRHCYATHLLEMGVDVKTLQHRLGHAHLQSTLIYLHVARVPHRETPSPFDFLKRKRPRPSPWEPPEAQEGPDAQR